MSPKQVCFEDVREGMELPTIVKHPTRRQLVMYAGASGDFYEIHYDQEYARGNGLPNVIIHGALKSAWLGQLMTEWMGVAGHLKKLEVQYRGMDVPGSPVYVRGVVRRKYQEDGQNLVECEVWLENQQGERTTRGTAVVALPDKSQS